MIGLLALCLAGADEPEPSYEVVVYGDMLVQQARDRVVEDLEQQGYDMVIERDNRTIFRNQDPWRGDVVLYDDGWMMVKRQPVRVEGREMPWAERNSALSWVGCVAWPFLCVRPNGQLVSTRRFRGQETRAVTRTHTHVTEWADRIADRAVSERLDALPADLDALWLEGVALDGTTLLHTHAERRRALLVYWASRTETPWGDRVREAVEGYIRGVVQHSDHPFTEEEVAEFHRSGGSTRPFPLRGATAELAP